MNRLPALMMVLVGLHVSASGAAQATGSSLVEASASDAASRPRSSDELQAQERARALFAEAKQMYADGDYESALERLRASYTLAPLPALLFDVAQTLRRLRRCGEASVALRAYLDTEHRPTLVARAEQTMRELADCHEQTPPPTPRTGQVERAHAPLAAPPAAPRRITWKRKAALLTLALGVGFAGSALGLALRGRLLSDEVSSARRWDAETARKDRQGVRSNRAAWSCGSLSLALLGSSLTLRLLDGGAPTDRAALLWTGSF